MATVSILGSVEEAQFLSSAFPALVKNGTNFPIMGLTYDASTDEAAFWKFKAKSFGSGNLTLILTWYADTATTGAVIWEVQVAAITPESDTGDSEAKSLASLTSQSDTNLGATGGRLHNCSITISNTDSIAANDEVWLRIARDANGTNGTDDMAGDAILVGWELTYSDA